MPKFSTIVVSNRLPVSVSKVDGKLSFSNSSGGLATAMASLEAKEKIWVGWPGIASDDLTNEDRTEIARELAKHGCVPVYLSAQQIKLFYEGYANDTLWPLFHYFQGLTVHKSEYWQAYREVNKLFMQATKKVARPEASIWVQDYQLMLLPKLLRAQLPEASIGFFLHIPFPSYEIFRLLPERREILEGLLGADLLGFHIYDYARHFLSSCLRLLGVSSTHGVMHYDGRIIKADSFPIGIDYDKFVSMRQDDEVLAAEESLKEANDVEFTLLSIDRLDYSKGIPERLDGFRLFLENNPQYLSRVKLVMVAVPSRIEVETYKELRDQIEVTVSRINGEFGTSEWAPISYQFQNLPFHEIVALYKSADVMLVTPIRDGMNLVAKEYVASQTEAEPGVLVLSEMAGAIDELPEAISVNPNDTLSIERSIGTALKMSKREKRRRQNLMQSRIRDYPVTRWGADFLNQLQELRVQQRQAANFGLTKEVQKDIIDQYQAAKKRLIVLDYDGTLQTFKASPAASAARPSKSLQTIISNLAQQPGNKLCIISGRKRSALESWFPYPVIELIAEHGAWQRRQGDWRKTAVDFEPARQIAQPILDDFTSRTPSSRIEQKDFASVWHYREVPVELAYVRAANLRRELVSALESLDVSVHAGNKIVEIKPNGFDKGGAMQSVVDRYQPDFVLVAGDDYTDEHMFKAASANAATIKVGPGETAARFRAIDVKRMLAFLTKLAD